MLRLEIRKVLCTARYRLQLIPSGELMIFTPSGALIRTTDNRELTTRVSLPLLSNNDPWKRQEGAKDANR